MDYELISNFLKRKEGIYVTRIIVFQLCHTHMPAPTEFINYYILSMYSAGNQVVYWNNYYNRLTGDTASPRTCFFSSSCPTTEESVITAEGMHISTSLGQDSSLLSGMYPFPVAEDTATVCWIAKLLSKALRAAAAFIFINSPSAKNTRRFHTENI